MVCYLQHNYKTGIRLQLEVQVLNNSKFYEMEDKSLNIKELPIKLWVCG